MMKCPKCGSEMEERVRLTSTKRPYNLHAMLEMSFEEMEKTLQRDGISYWKCKCGHEEKVGAKSSSLEHSKNIALGYPTDAQMDEAVRRTNEKVGGCSDCERQPIPDCEKCEKVGGEKR